MYDSTQICGRSIYKEKQYCCSKNIISYLKPVWPWGKVSRSCNQSVAVSLIMIPFEEHDSLWFGLNTARMKSEVVNSFIGKAFHQYMVNDCEINKKKTMTKTLTFPFSHRSLPVHLRTDQDWFESDFKEAKNQIAFLQDVFFLTGAPLKITRCFR